MTEKMKQTLVRVLAVVFLFAVGAWMLMNPGPEHIEDTNGPDNYALQQITEADVLALKMGTRGGPSQSEVRWNFGNFSVSDGVKYSGKKFTGVYRLHTCTIFQGSDIHVSLGEFAINSGNFAFYVVFDGEIVGQVTPGGTGFSEFILEDIDKTGTLEYIIAGESANFQFVAPAGF